MKFERFGLSLFLRYFSFSVRLNFFLFQSPCCDLATYPLQYSYCTSIMLLRKCKKTWRVMELYNRLNSRRSLWMIFVLRMPRKQWCVLVYGNGWQITSNSGPKGCVVIACIDREISLKQPS